ncbi:hypothetical protein [Acrocarpospora sp. B8E8]|uniref:golvesin C-terminal-like domain-containing protein n=1 Tax=Acrocarpospora sp. B8E8 TaxID=3153572 RepID=UPI00325DFE5E
MKIDFKRLLAGAATLAIGMTGWQTGTASADSASCLATTKVNTFTATGSPFGGTTLSWNVTPGCPGVAVVLLGGVGENGGVGANGNVVKNPATTTEYRLYAMTGTLLTKQLGSQVVLAGKSIGYKSTQEGDSVTVGPCGTPPWNGYNLQFYPKTIAATQPWVARWCPAPGSPSVTSVSLGYYGTGGYSGTSSQPMCIPQNTEVPIGTKILTPGPDGYPRQAPPHDPGELVTHTGGGGLDCASLPPGDWPGPRVRLEAKLRTSNAAVPGESSRPIKHAKVALFYLGPPDGEDPDALPEWQPVRKKAGNTGDAVIAHTNGNGDLSLDFNYPQDHQLADGSTWFGCRPSDPPLMFLRSHACEDSDIELRVYGESEDGSVIVKGLDNAVAELDAIPIGRFFQDPSDPITYNIDNPGGHAYRGAYNVKDVTASLPDGLRPGNVAIRLTNQDGSRYDAASRTVLLSHVDAPFDSVEHEVAHSYHHHLAASFPDIPNTGCQGHRTPDPSDVWCAWTEGLAEFLAAAAVNGPGNLSPPITYRALGLIDVEECGLLANGQADIARCQPGPEVEGRIMAALWDIYDAAGDEEDEHGLRDRLAEPLQAIAAVVASAEPDTFAEFWSAWRYGRAISGPGDEDNETMFANTLVYSAIEDADKALGTGTWNEVACNNCLGGMFLRSAPSWEQTAEMAWQPTLSPQSGVKYHVWVHLPNDGNLAGRDGRAGYLVPTSAGQQTVTVDQSASSGWVRITGEALDLSPGPIRLVNGDTTRLLAADGLIVVPNN